MTNYTKSTNFATKDTLTSGDPLKIVKGTEIDTEFNNIATAVNSKADTASPTFTTPSLGVATATSINKVTITAPATSATLTVVDGSTLATSGAYSLTLTSTAATNVTLPTTGTLATLAGSETFTNKTLTSPAISGTPTGVGVLTSGTAVASTSGTSIDFTGIPSWVKRITVMFNGVSTNGTSLPRIQIGDGSVNTSGYTGTTTALVDGASINGGGYGGGFDIRSAIATDVLHGTVVLTTLGSNIWVASGLLGDSGRIAAYTVGGSKTLSGTLDRLRITTVNGTDTFDAGSINILYE